jgi:hypothetical protein
MNILFFYKTGVVGESVEVSNNVPKEEGEPVEVSSSVAKAEGDPVPSIRGDGALVGDGDTGIPVVDTGDLVGDGTLPFEDEVGAFFVSLSFFGPSFLDGAFFFSGFEPFVDPPLPLEEGAEELAGITPPLALEGAAGTTVRCRLFLLILFRLPLPSVLVEVGEGVGSGWTFAMSLLVLPMPPGLAALALLLLPPPLLRFVLPTYLSLI